MLIRVKGAEGRGNYMRKNLILEALNALEEGCSGGRFRTLPGGEEMGSRGPVCKD